MTTLAIVSVADLWLPILVAAVAVFILSALTWTVMPHHKKEWNRAEIEPEILAGIKEKNVPPGQYMFPYVECGKDMKSPEKKALWEAGPWGTLIVFPGLPNMGRNMGLSFVFYAIVGVFVAYISGLALQPGADFMQVLQVAGTCAIMCYALGGIPTGIWFGKPARCFFTDLFDAVLYSAVTGVIFALLWPAANGVADAAGAAGL